MITMGSKLITVPKSISDYKKEEIKEVEITQVSQILS